jgi:hypothetical protein
MAVSSDRPYGSFNFRVSLGAGGKASVGFSEIVLPAFLTQARTPPGLELPPADTQMTLVLRRGFAGTLELYDWWNKARRSKRTRARTVTVELLNETLERPVVTWIFSGCVPIKLAYSRLDAQSSALLIETLELSFEDVEMA